MFVKKMAEVPAQRVPVGHKAFVQVLINDQEAPNFIMRRFIIEAQGFIPRHTNSVEHEQLVLRGRARIGIGDKEFEVSRDNVIFIPAHVEHWYKNIGDEPFEFLCLIPNKEDKMTLLEKQDDAD